jgi:uracil-DNA glycosylase family 4
MGNDESCKTMIRLKNKSVAARWYKHRTRWEDCQKCPLRESRTNVVLARGSLPCQVLFLGEAPGDSEDGLKEPFVGDAGKLLDSMILDALTAESVESPRIAMTNVVCCRPPRKEDKQFRAPDKKEAKACSPRLSEFIRIADPSVIVLVGKTAERYRPKDYFYERIKHFSIVHPAAILRKGDNLSYHRAVITLRAIFREHI